MPVYESPKTIAGESIGDFLLDLNDWGEIRISSKYGTTTFVISDNNTKEFANKLNSLQNRKEAIDMEKGIKKFWEVKCLMCKTEVVLNIDDYKIISTDQAAEFIRRPNFICGKCRSDCVVRLKEIVEKEQ